MKIEVLIIREFRSFSAFSFQILSSDSTRYTVSNDVMHNRITQ